MAETKKTSGNRGRNKGIENLRPFVKGQSGNPSGRPKVPEDVKEMFRAATPDAVKMLVSVINNDKEKTSDRIRAAEIILDRHLGKAVQAVDMDLKSVPQVVIKGESDILD